MKTMIKIFARCSAFIDMVYHRIFHKKECFQMVFDGLVEHNDILHFPGQYHDAGWINGTQYRYLYNGWIVRHYA